MCFTNKLFCWRANVISFVRVHIFFKVESKIGFLSVWNWNFFKHFFIELLYPFYTWQVWNIFTQIKIVLKKCLTKFNSDGKTAEFSIIPLNTTKFPENTRIPLNTIKFLGISLNSNELCWIPQNSLEFHKISRISVQISNITRNSVKIYKFLWWSENFSKFR